MREDRTPASSRGADQSAADAQPNEGSVGFQRHTPTNARRIAAGRPRPQRQSADASPDAAAQPRSERSARSGRQDAAGAGAPRAASRGGDYLGTGKACRVCGKPVDPTQSRCPHCGAFQRPLYANPLFLGGAIVVVAIVVLLSIGINSCASKAPAPGSEGKPTVQVESKEDKTAINDAIATAQATIDENTASPTYTAATIAGLQAAIVSAQGVSDDPNATVEQIDQAIADLSSASDALVLRPVAFGSSYDWPWYDPLVESLNGDGSYLGAQVAMEGTVESVSSGTAGSVAIIASSGDTTCPIELTCTNMTDLSAVGGSLTQGARVSFAGTVTGLVSHDNGDGTTSQIPAITADYVSTYEE